MHLLPWDAIEALALHYGLNTVKYPARNWEAGLKWNEGCAASLARHFAAWSKGEDIDKENGAYHDVAMAWNAIALIAYRLRNIGEDDRPKSNTITSDTTHSIERNSGYSITPVAAGHQPATIVMPGNISNMVIKDYDSTDLGTSGPTII